MQVNENIRSKKTAQSSLNYIWKYRGLLVPSFRDAEDCFIPSLQLNLIIPLKQHIGEDISQKNKKYIWKYQPFDNVFSECGKLRHSLFRYDLRYSFSQNLHPRCEKHCYTVDLVKLHTKRRHDSDVDTLESIVSHIVFSECEQIIEVKYCGKLLFLTSLWLKLFL